MTPCLNYAVHGVRCSLVLWTLSAPGIIIGSEDILLYVLGNLTNRLKALLTTKIKDNKGTATCIGSCYAVNVGKKAIYHGCHLNFNPESGHQLAVNQPPTTDTSKCYRHIKN